MSIFDLIRDADGSRAIDQDALYIRSPDGTAWNHKLSLYNGSVIMTYAPMSIQRYRDMPICAYEHKTVALYDCMREAAYDENVMP